MRQVRITVCVVGTLLGVTAAGRIAHADEAAVAIVEETSGKVAGVEPLDLLRAGKTIALPAESGLIISYLNSCQRENIRGGKVTIGTEQSQVDGGEISRKRVACDPAALDLTPEQANQSATLVFRKPPIDEGVKFVMETQQPLVIAPGLQEITVEDMREDHQAIWSVKVVDGVADLTDGREVLAKGGRYRLTGAGKSVVFQIGKEATEAPLPLLKRVIRF